MSKVPVESSHRSDWKLCRHMAMCQLLSPSVGTTVKMHHIQSRSPWVGLIIAPMTVPLVYLALAIPFVGPAEEYLEAGMFGLLRYWGFVASMVAAYSYASSTALGIPLFIALKRMNRFTGFWFIPLSALLGAAELTALFSWSLTWPDTKIGMPLWKAGIEVGLLGGVLGFLVGVPFFAISRITMRQR